jgi:effector-binding domain-containing protein
MTYAVVVQDVEARPTAVVPATTTWAEYPALWPVLSGEVWACLRAADIHRGCRNVMLYLDGTPRVEVGVELSQPCPLTGRVVSSSLPAGRVAKTVHYGSYAELGAAHDAVTSWCAKEGLARTGVRWEVYGPHDADPAKVWTEIYHQLA